MVSTGSEVAAWLHAEVRGLVKHAEQHNCRIKRQTAAPEGAAVRPGRAFRPGVGRHKEGWPESPVVRCTGEIQGRLLPERRVWADPGGNTTQA